MKLDHSYKNNSTIYIAIISKLILVPVLLAVLVSNVGSKNHIINLIQKLDILIIALLVNQSALILFAHRMQMLLRINSIKINFLNSLRIHLESIFYYYFLPMSVGMELSRCFKIKNINNEAKISKIIFTLIQDRFIGALSALFLVIIISPFIEHSFSVYKFINTTTVSLVFLIFSIAFIFVYKNKKLSTYSINFIKLIMKHYVLIAYTLAISIMMQFIFGYGIYLFAKSLGITVGVTETIFAVNASMLLMIIPFTILGAGPVEASAVAIFIFLGLNLNDSIIMASLGYLARIIGAFQGAVWEIIDGGFEVKKLKAMSAEYE